MKKSQTVGLTVVMTSLVIYAAVALTPISSLIGRYSPAAASIFSPFFFNFLQSYDSGKVLEFSIGMSRSEFLATLVREYMGQAEIIVDCRVTTGESLVAVTPGIDIGVHGKGQRFCARLDSRRSGLSVEFDGDVVARIEVWFVRQEGI